MEGIVFVYMFAFESDWCSTPAVLPFGGSDEGEVKALRAVGLP
jgi:hypothetical protein